MGNTNTSAAAIRAAGIAIADASSWSGSDRHGALPLCRLDAGTGSARAADAAGAGKAAGDAGIDAAGGGPAAGNGNSDRTVPERGKTASQVVGAAVSRLADIAGGGALKRR